MMLHLPRSRQHDDRRLHLPLLLWLCVGLALLLGQHAALSHQLEHLPGAEPYLGRSLADTDKGEPESGHACERCHLFAHVEHVVGGIALLPMPLADLSYGVRVAAQEQERSEAPGQRRNRGPPAAG